MTEKIKGKGEVGAKIVSSGKRLSVLNEQEHMQLRRKLGFYSKIHEKELSNVEKQLGEIKAVMKTMSNDNLLGSRVLENFPSSSDNLSASFPPPEGKTDAKLMRSHSLPSFAEPQRSQSASSERKRQEMKETAKMEPTRKLLEGDRVVLPKPKAHQKVTRSFTSPGSFPQPPQPLMKTTPELVKRKISHANSLHREISRSHSGEKNKLPSVTFPPKTPVLVRHDASSAPVVTSSTPRAQTADLIRLEMNIPKQQSSPAAKTFNDPPMILRGDSDNEKQSTLQAKYTTTWNKREKLKRINST